MGLLRKAGIDVVTESEEGQRVLDTANGRGVTLNKAQKRALKTVSISDNQKHRRTVVSSADGAKIQKNLYTLAEKIEKISQTPLRTFIGDLAKALGAEREGSGSEYAFFTTPNGEDVTIRLANHNATVSNFDYRNEDNGISVVIAKSRDTNRGINNDGKAHIVEYYYTETDLRKAFGKPLADIVRSIKGALNSGEFVDTTGLAEREEVNAEQVRQHRVYHGSGADFERFDHSHMGEGEGGQSFGWGTYVTEVEGIGKRYAQLSRDNLVRGGQFRTFVNGREREQIADLLDWAMREENQPLDDVRNRVWANLINYARNHPNVISREKWDEIDKILSNFTEEDVEKYKTKPTLYTVEIPRDNGKNYIDFNAPMISEKLKKAIGDKLKELGFVKIDVGNGRTVYGRGYTRIDLDESFSSIQDNLGFVLGSGKEVSELLHSAGFVGIKYPADYYNGGRSDGAKNYVIFDEGDLQITDKVKFFRTESGEAYGFTMGGKIYLDPKIATAETPVHEYTHLWAAALRAANPKAWEQLKNELEKDKELVAYVRGLYPELAESNGSNGSNGLSDELAEEVFAHFSGRRGAERLRAEQERMEGETRSIVGKAKVIAMFENLRNALKKFWDAARDLFAGKGVKNESAEDFADMVLADLVGGYNPKADAGVKLQRSKADEQTKSENFKKWFGDWESASLIRQAQNAWNDKESKNKYAFAPSERLAKAYKDLLGHDINSVVITDDAIRHIKNNHSQNEALRGQVDMLPEDIALIPYVLNNYDTIELSPEYDDKMGNRAIEVKKRINGVSVVATIEKGKDKEFLVTSWKYMSSNALDAAKTTPGPNVRNDFDAAKIQKEIDIIKKSLENSSKVVDEDGKPLVVYHSTTLNSTRRFFKFKTKKPAWFTPSRGYSEAFTTKMRGTRSFTYPVYLNIKNPIEVGDIDGIANESNIKRLADYTGIPIETLQEILSENGGLNIFNITNTERFKELLQAKGYDGIIAREGGVTSYAVFEPTQIKSATENVGTFDGENPDIRYQKADSDVRIRGEEEPVFYSNAMRAVENIKQERATPEQWLKMIEKNGGYRKSSPSRLGELFVFLVG